LLLNHFAKFISSQVSAKILIEKWDVQNEAKYATVTHSVKDKTHMTVDVHALADADDIIVTVAAYSKIDGVYNPFVRPDPIHVCTIHEHEDPLVQYIHDEVLKFGNITKACPLKKGGYYYLHDFIVDEEKFPMPLPEGEFRVDINGTILDGGKEIHVYTSELFFKTVKE